MSFTSYAFVFGFLPLVVAGCGVFSRVKKPLYTKALGTLINTAGTEDVAAAYAATYPIALISVVLVSQFLIILF